MRAPDVSPPPGERRYVPTRAEPPTVDHTEPIHLMNHGRRIG
jgi:hypothetical protein